MLCKATVSALLALLAGASAHAEGTKAPNERVLFNAEQTAQLNRMPLGGEVILPTSRKGSVVFTLTGRELGEDGRPFFRFYMKRPATADEAARANGKAYVINPNEAPRGPDGPGTPGNAPGASSPAPGLPSPITDGWGESLGRIGGGALDAAGTAGVVNGLILPPWRKRQMRHLQGEIEGEAREFNQTRDGFVEDVRAVHREMEQLLGGAPDSSGSDGSGSFPAGEGGDFADSPIGQRITKVRQRLAYGVPAGWGNQAARGVAIAAANACEAAYNEKQAADAEDLAGMAEGFADLAFALNPKASFFKDGVEFFTGRHLLTGRQLNPLEQSLAGVGFVAGYSTYGIGSSLAAAVRGTFRILKALNDQIFGPWYTVLGILDNGLSYGLRSPQGCSDLVRQTRAMSASPTELYKPGPWVRPYWLDRIHNADALNALWVTEYPLRKAPYLSGGVVHDVTTRRDEVFLRLHGAGDQKGRWLIRGEAGDRSLSPADLKEKYSLPSAPGFVTEVRIPPGTPLRRSPVNSNVGKFGPAYQYEVLNGLEGASFGKAVPLTDGLRTAPLDEIP